MQSKRFGVAWIVHQTLPGYAKDALKGEDDTEQQRNRARQALAMSEAALAHIMPCRFCRTSYAGFRIICDAKRCFVEKWRSDSPQIDTDGTDCVEKYYFSVHNLVNAKLGKPLLLPADRDTPAFTRAANAHRFRCALIEWLAIIAMNYQTIEPSNARQRYALRRLIDVASQQDGPVQSGALWRTAFDQQRDLAQVVDQWMENTLDASNGAEIDRSARARAWLVLYLDALCTALESQSTPQRARRCAAALRREFGLISARKGSALGAFASSNAMLNAVFKVKTQCVLANEQCESLDEFMQRMQSYRANQCANGTCK